MNAKVLTSQMKVTCRPAVLGQALQVVSRAISSRTTLPILNNILIETTPDGLALTATNLEIGIRKLVPAEVASEGSTTAPARLLTDFVGTLPDDDLEMTLDVATQSLNLRCARFDTHIKCIEAEEFPPGPRPDEGDRLEVALDDLVAAVEQTQMAASTDEARPVLTGVLVQVQGGGLTLAATDGHRLAVRKLAAAGPTDLEASLIVPARALAELARVLKGEPGKVEIIISKARNQVFFRAGSSEVSQRVTLEYKAGYFTVDAFELGSDGLLVPRAQGILQPFTSPEMAAYPADAIDARRLWVSARESYGGLSYNTKLVPSELAPKTWQDLLKPQYRGKMAFPGSPTTSAEWVGVLLTTYGEDFVRKLGTQDIRVYKMTARALQNLVSSGEVAIAARASNAHVAEDRRKNAPVAWVAPGPVPVTSTVAAVAARPPHPHAAMLMVDFLLSEEGQRMYQEIGYNSARKGLEDRDTPKEKVYFTQRATFVEDFETWAELFRAVFVNKR